MCAGAGTDFDTGGSVITAQMLPVLTTMCSDRQLRQVAVSNGLVDVLVPWFASPCTSVRTSAVCLLTKFADSDQGLQAFRNVSSEAVARAGLYTGSDGAWVQLWVELSRHPHDELRRVASESLRSFFNWCVPQWGHACVASWLWCGHVLMRYVRGVLQPPRHRASSTPPLH